MIPNREKSPLVLLDSFSQGSFASSWRFAGHLATLEATTPLAVPALLARVEQAVTKGLYAVGFVAYEAASALNPDLPPLSGLEGLPLAWFALYQKRYAAGGEDEPAKEAQQTAPELHATLSQDEHAAILQEIRSRIAAGESYQVNYTFPLTGTFRGDPITLYRRVAVGQQTPFAAYLDIGRFVVMSASPELFFAMRGGVITARPMKGTATRGRWAGEDLALAKDLADSDKERAENLMIVDLLRNDLGKVAETGAVTVESLFALESYPTVHQLTSTVSARLRPGTSLTETFQALFPCGSVTGAPKRRSMEIIAGLEKVPRGVYCGAIGCVAPGGEATFSVPIRTLLLDRSSSRLSLHVGSGITWDSNATDEYRECMGKAAFVGTESKPFVLIETMRFEGALVKRVDRHIDRMEASASYFGFPFDRAKAIHLLASVAADKAGTLRLRLVMDCSGTFTMTTAPLTNDTAALRVSIASVRIDSKDRFRYHKTSHRELLDNERLKRSDCDELIFINELEELTEGSYHNLVLRLAGRLVTPRLESGLLPGILRGELLEAGEISEDRLYLADLQQAEEIWLINSLRGWRPAFLVQAEQD